MPKYYRRKTPTCEGIFIDVENLSWEAISGNSFPVVMLERGTRAPIGPKKSEMLASETDQEPISKLGTYRDIDLIDIFAVLIALYGQEHALYLMACLPESLEKLAKMREQDNTQKREVTKEDQEIIPAIIISSYTKEVKKRSVYERVGIVLHLIAIGLSIWWRCI